MTGLWTTIDTKTLVCWLCSRVLLDLSDLMIKEYYILTDRNENGFNPTSAYISHTLPRRLDIAYACTQNVFFKISSICISVITVDGFRSRCWTIVGCWNEVTCFGDFVILRKQTLTKKNSFSHQNLNEIVPKSRSQWGLRQEPHWESRTLSRTSSKIKNLIKNLIKNQYLGQDLIEILIEILNEGFFLIENLNKIIYINRYA